MTEMAQLLPFSFSSVVQRVLRCPLVSKGLDRSGYFVYCLLSPYLTKVYVGATGFLGPRAPYERLREQLRKVNLWQSASSQRCYLSRTPSLYAAIKKTGLGNVIQVILAETTAEALTAREWLRTSPIFNADCSCR